jgi:uncharacterized delta-60 repeat protein
MRTSCYKFFAGDAAWSAAGRRQAGRRSPRSFRPHLEVLEGRTLLSAGALDSTFGTGGQVTTDFPGFTQPSALALAIQTDGKIVAAGSANETTSEDIALARYNPDGSLDSGFGTGGRVTTTVGSTFNQVGLVFNHVGLALQPDGKIVASAEILSRSASDPNTETTHLVLVRYQPDGSLDAGFGTAGEAKLDNVGGSSVVIQPDNKILVAGTNFVQNIHLPPPSTSAVGTLARFNPDGSLDVGFGTNGVVTNFGSGGYTIGMALQVDGRVVALTELFVAATTSDVTRFNPNGSVDNTFGSSGQAVVGISALSLALQPDSRIVVAGFVPVTLGTAFAVTRLKTNGTPDATFGGGSPVITNFGSSTGASADAVAVQQDGRIVVAGQELTLGTTSPPVFEFGLIRYDPNGNIDTTFGNSGQVVNNFGRTQSSANALAIQADGKLVAAGFARNDPGASDQVFAVARYLADPPIADPNQRFLTHVYLDLLGRLPDPSGQASWTGLLNQGATRTQVVQMIEASAEYQSDAVQYLYGYVLGRAADSTGMSGWSNFLAQGGTAEQLEANLLGSDEYFAGRGGGNNNSFLQGVYRDVLGRSLDSSGSQTWNQALSAGVSRTDVAAAILASRESDTDEVQALYAKILRRTADSSGLSFFTNDIQQGVPNEAVLATLAGSDEYFARP